MNVFEPGLDVGEDITNLRLREIFACSSQGGMRRSLRTGTLVLVSGSPRWSPPYVDRFRRGEIHYVGMGLRGDQSLSFAQNRTLAESNTNGVDVYMFECFQTNTYTFVGKVQLAGAPYAEVQEDIDGLPRRVWVFPLERVHA